MYATSIRAMITGNQPDLRNAIRFPLHLPVALKTPTGEYRAETRDISAGGILLQTESEIAPGSAVEFTIRMPGDVLGAEQDVLVKCTGRVVRCSEEGKCRCVAVATDEYQFERT